ncbi:class I SAM-dependent methyltransferase [Aliiroseovarius sp. S1123]|jgi:SAM-dependent methyltransferase|uniref:class I SAM-dependent methyltransferase n=1 Tax=unclassified Aliiroseovarius TaxID=2623558 RepID=UPI001FF25171|nr:class I SAM-dependent methyltransferase [Aliiroseovarius sp. S1123]MCK0170458.1 class I SAM-dependent methyltransferase [Aliiroseovarius sp. S1123]
MAAKYDSIGTDYAQLRKPDPRIATRIEAALGDAQKILNVGAGAGSYEPVGRLLTAVEPSAKMISQRVPSSTRVVKGVAEDLPFEDNSFDAAMAVLTIHHWTDQAKGLSEMRRVTKGPLVILTYDPAFRDFWLLNYFPDLAALDEGQMPPIAAYTDWLGDVEISNMPIPHDCTDGFLAAYWRRPEAYLDPRIRAAMSSFHAIGDVSRELSRLASDLADGTWERANAELLELGERDCGYRLVTTG